MIEEDEKSEDMDEKESFAELFEGSFVKRISFHTGQKIKAKVVKTSAEFVFIDLGGKSEGYLDSKELRNDEGRLTVREGDTIEAYFLSENNNEMRFTTRIAGGEAARQYIEEAWRSGIPLEGLVEREIKGGYEIKIAGSLRGFCPYSQMGLQRAANPGEYVGQHLSFRISQYGEGGRNIILSNRSVLEEERRGQREALKSSLQEGMIVKGTVSSIRNFGAFVKIGVVEGLIPISEIGWDRVEDINQVLSVGQEVDVLAMKLDWEKDRLSFSIKKAMPDPWQEVEKKFPEGSRHSGTVARLTNFGAFVTLAPGIDGLVHISKLGAGKRINHPREVLTKGQDVQVKIEGIDKENKRLSLSLASTEKTEAEQERGEDYTKYLREKPGSMGTLADLLKAKLEGKKK